MAVVATACGSGDDSATDAPAETDAPAATADDWRNEIVALAQEEGKITAYVDWGASQYEVIIEGFEAKYGIEVEIIRDLYRNIGPAIDIELETGNGIADVIVFAGAGIEQFEAYADAGHFLEPIGPAFDGRTAYDTDAFVKPGGFFNVGGVFSGWGWNTDVWPDGISGWDDYLDPGLAGGKIGVQPPTASVNAEWWMWVESQASEGWLEKFSAQDPIIYESAVPMNEGMISTEIFVALRAYGVLVNPAIEAGAPLAFGVVDPAEGGTIDGGFFWSGVLSTAPHPNAAWLFEDYVLSEEGQIVWTSDSASVIPGVGAVQVKDIYENPPLTEEEHAAYVEKWNALFVG